MGRNEPIQRIIGIGGVIFRLTGIVAAHKLVEDVAVGITLVDVFLGLGRLLAEVCVIQSKQAASTITSKVLHPAVCILHLRYVGHAVVEDEAMQRGTVADCSPPHIVATSLGSFFMLRLSTPKQQYQHQSLMSV